MIHGTAFPHRHGNARKLAELPHGCHLGDNANVFLGGFRLWQPAAGRKPHK